MKNVKQHLIKGLFFMLGASIVLPNMAIAAQEEISTNKVKIEMEVSQSADKENTQQPMSMKTDSHESMEKENTPEPMLMNSNDNKATGTRDPFANSGGYKYRGMEGWEESDEMTVSKVIFDQLEYRNGDNTKLNRWDMQAWRGTDYEKFWVKFEGEDIKSESGGEFEFQALYSKAVSAYWDLQYGVRYDRQYGTEPNNERYYGVVGVQGLAPYWFEMEPTLFVDSNGKISARVVASYDLLLSQRLILQPRAEINASLSDLPELGIGQGVNVFRLDLRLRYEFKREIAPYLGIIWQKQYGDSARYSRQQGNSSEFTEVVLGVRIWF